MTRGRGSGAGHGTRKVGGKEVGRAGERAGKNGGGGRSGGASAMRSARQRAHLRDGPDRQTRLSGITPPDSSVEKNSDTRPTRAQQAVVRGAPAKNAR